VQNNKTAEHEASYIRHSKSDELQYGANSERGKNIDVWLDQGTVGAWRHRRMLSAVDPLIKVYPSAKWLTVGDSMFGFEAHYLQEHGVDVVASNITKGGFDEAVKRGFIKKYSIQNAEALTFADEEFDFVLCKLSYHHFPRPPVAFYEMIRVARLGIVLIEPNDRYILDTPLQKILNNRIFYWFLEKALGLKEKRFDFEHTGSYVFSISCREIEKLALAIQCRMVAFKGFNDYVSPQDHFQPALKGNSVFRRAKLLIKLHDIAAKMKIIKYRNLCAVVIKNDPSEELLKELNKAGYDMCRFPINPYK